MEASIGVDIGSTSIKAVLYAPALDRVLEVREAPVPPRLPSADGRYEVDTTAVLEECGQVIAELSSRARKPLGIAFTCQMHGGVLLDEATGDLSPFVTWQDKRGDEPSGDGTFVDWLRSRVPRKAWDESPLHTGFLGTTAAWWAREGLRGTRLAGIGELAASVLLGVPLVADVSAGEAWGLYSAEKERWRYDVIDAIGIPRGWLPDVVPTGTIVGRLDSDTLGLPAGLPVRAGIGDTQACYLGSTCRPDEALVNFGTGSQVMWESRERPTYPGTDLRCLPGGRWLVTGATLAGGRAYDVLADFVTDVVTRLGLPPPDRSDLYEALNRLAESDPRGLRFHPQLLGSRFKGEHLRGSIEGIGVDNFRLDALCAALVTGLADELAEVHRAAPGSHRALVGSGNALRRNRALHEAVQRSFSLPLRLAPHEEEAAVGAARIAAGLM